MTDEGIQTMNIDDDMSSLREAVEERMEGEIVRFGRVVLYRDGHYLMRRK